MRWVMNSYGPNLDQGRWTITDGRLQFDVHQLINGSSREVETHYIVTPEQSTAYANKILDALNAADVHIDWERERNHDT